jgi:hypothetical protein
MAASNTATKHRTTPIADTITAVPHYPKKLTIFKTEASSYWQVRCYMNGKILKRSTKTENKRDALTFAKDFYNELLRRDYEGESLHSTMTFRNVALKMLDEMDNQVKRNEITKQTAQMARLRLNKSAYNQMNTMDVVSIHYDTLQELLQRLGNEPSKLGAETIKQYLKLARKVLSHAHRMRYIKSVPAIPTIKSDSKARGYFNSNEYNRLHRRANSLIGKRFEERVIEGKGRTLFKEGETTEGRLLRKIKIEQELYELIIFMSNSFIRPTDIKNLQHKHIEVKKGKHNYLVLNLPPSKKKDKPIATMEKAVEIYERLTDYNKENYEIEIEDEKTKEKKKVPMVRPDDYLFYPNLQRDYALKQLQRQFDVLTWHAGLKRGANGEERTIYSLRHTCIMFRLTEGDNIDYITLAKNARTSVEMIEKHYASQLEGELNIDMLQSKRRKR